MSRRAGLLLRNRPVAGPAWPAWARAAVAVWHSPVAEAVSVAAAVAVSEAEVAAVASAAAVVADDAPISH